MHRGLAQALLIVGILVVAFGGYQFATNQPKEVKMSQDSSLEGALDNLGNAVSNVLEAPMREKARKNGIVMMVAGGVIALIGGVGLAGGRKA